MYHLFTILAGYRFLYSAKIVPFRPFWLVMFLTITHHSIAKGFDDIFVNLQFQNRSEPD